MMRETILDAGVVIFDIDGTLVDSAGFEDACYLGALRDVLGEVVIHADWSHYRHVTDTGILDQIIRENALTDAERIVERVRRRFGERIRDFFDQGGACPAVPGAPEAVAGLVEQGLAVGIATGGWRHTAQMKLVRAGFDLRGLTLSTGDDAMDRAGIMTSCLHKLGGDEHRVVYFGDGPWDMKATEALGWRFVGVGPRLDGKCDYWISDFHDPGWLWSPGGPAPFDPQPVLRGDLVVLEPLRAEHFEALYAAAADPDIWVQHPVPNRHERVEFQKFFDESLESGGALVIRDGRSGGVIGASRFHGYDRAPGEVEIGWTFLARPYWGGTYNREIKRLMLEHAFRFVDRVVFLIHPANHRSRRAVEKIGGTRAGTRRNGAGVLNDLFEIRPERFRAYMAVQAGAPP